MVFFLACLNIALRWVSDCNLRSDTHQHRCDSVVHIFHLISSGPGTIWLFGLGTKWSYLGWSGLIALGCGVIWLGRNDQTPSKTAFKNSNWDLLYVSVVKHSLTADFLIINGKIFIVIYCKIDITCKQKSIFKSTLISVIVGNEYQWCFYTKSYKH